EELVKLSPAEVNKIGAEFTMDLNNTVEAKFWRVRDWSGSMLPMAELLFRVSNTEIMADKLNRDDYQQLPNKAYTGQRALQFWFDKQINPQLWVWPVPERDGD